MGYPDDELRPAPRATLNTQPGAALAQAVAARTPDPTRAAFNQQPGQALANTVAERAPRVPFNTQPGAALAQAAAERAPRIALGAQPGQGLVQAIEARAPAAPPVNATRAAFGGQPGAAIAAAAAERAPGVPPVAGGDSLRVAQPRTTYGAPPAAAAMPNPQTAALLQGAPGSAPIVPQTVTGAQLAGNPQPLVAPATAPAAAPAAPAGQTGARAIQGPPVPRPVSAPLTPNQLPGTPQWPNPNTGGAGAMSREAQAWNAGRQALAGPTQSGTPLMPAPQTAESAAARPATGAAARAAAPAGTSAAPGAPGAYNRTMAAGSEQLAKMLPQGGAPTGAIGRAAMAAGRGTLNTAGRVAPFVQPLIETARTAKVALDPKEDKLAVATQAAEGIGRGGATLAGAGLGASLGAAGGPFAPVTVPLGGLVGGGLGYWGGDKAIRSLRSMFGLDTASPVDRTNARNEAALAAAQTRALAATPARAPAATPAAPPAARPAAPAAAPAPRAPATPRGRGGIAAQADDQLAALAQHYTGLQAQLDASPIARTVLGGGQSAVYYKDGTVVNLPAGQALPDDVQQHMALGNAMSQIENGTYRMPAPATAQAGGADGTPAQFAATYGPALQGAAQKLGVHPNLLLAQFGHETGWGKSVIPGTNNLGNIKDFSGAGVGATDNMTGSRDKYMQFKSPEAFADHYADLIARKYPGAVGVGDDMSKFAQALKGGGYAEDPNYVNALMGAYQTLGPITASSSTPMQSPAMVTEEGVPAAASSAGGLPFARGPVQILRGMQDSTALPNGGGAGYTEVPTSVYQAGVRQGNASAAGRGPIANYLDQAAQGEGFAVNPAGGRLAQEAMKNDSAERVANMGLQSHLATADATRYKADSEAESVKKNVIMVPVETGDIDPYTKQPVRVNMPFRQDANGQLVSATPQAPDYPVPTAHDIKLLRENDSVQNQAYFNQTYGPGAAKHILNKAK